MRAFIHIHTHASTYATNLRPVTRFRSMNVDWIAGHHLPWKHTRCRTQAAVCCAYTMTIIRMAITTAAAIHEYASHYLSMNTTSGTRYPHAHTHTRASRARKSTRIPGNRLRCAAPAGIEFIIPLGTAPLPDHFRVFAFHGTDRHVPPIESSFSISLYFLARYTRIRKFPETFAVFSRDKLSLFRLKLNEKCTW